MIKRTLLAALFAAVALPAAALEAPKDFAGKWSLGGVSEGDESCTLTLGDEGAIGGWTIDIPQDCFDKLGISTDIAAWTLYPDGAIGFIDPLRKPLLRFGPAEIGGYVGEPSEGPTLSLDRLDPDAKEPTEQERMSGRWALMSMGDTLCAWESKASKDGQKGTLKAAAPCQPAWAGRKVVAWERAKGRLMLIDAKGKMVLALPGDSIEGFFSPQDVDDTYGFVRDWD